MRKVLLEEMSWVEIGEAMAGGVDTAVVIVGATEQHGPHLPIFTDSIIAQVVGEEVTRALGNALMAPMIGLGCSKHHMAFAGTITLRPETLEAILADYCRCLAQHGFANIVLLSTHGGNFEVMAKMTKEMDEEIKGSRVIGYSDLKSFLSVFHSVAAEHDIAPNVTGLHAGEWETSMVLAMREDLVLLDRAEPGYLGEPMEALPVLREKGMQAVAESGVLGDPTIASAERGRAYLRAAVDYFVGFIKGELGRSGST